MALLTTALRGRLDLFTYRSILAAPTWGFITEAVVATRAYVTGLEAGLTLLQMTEGYRAHLTPSEGAAHRRALYLFILDMLDRSDEWDGYLTAWEQIRTHTHEVLTYRADARLAATRMAPFILGRTRDTLLVHFLFPTSHRKAVIERKVQAQRAGRRLGNRRHHPQSELSASERRRRLDRIVALARTTGPYRP